MTRKLKIFVFSIWAVLATTWGSYAARADDLDTAVYIGVNELRPACGMIANDPLLSEAAQRHADDMVTNDVDGHIGSDGSSPGARIADAGHVRSGYTAEIVYWGTGSVATPSAALAMWMESPPHRAIILNCSFTTAGFATASKGNRMAIVGDFAGP